MLREFEFNMICRRHSDEVYRFARGLLGNNADAEDATQEVLLRVWNHLPKARLFRMRAWIMELTRNYCLDQIRRRSRPAFPIPSDHATLAEHPDDTTPDPSEGADAAYWRANLHAALMELPELQRSVFLLYEVNGLRYHEVANTLGIPINSVKVYLLRARQKLQRLLADHEPCLNT